MIERFSWHDNYYGACSCHRCGPLPKFNYLGLILMTVRESVR